MNIIPPAKPSRPSIQLIAFIVPTIQSNVTNILNVFGRANEKMGFSEKPKFKKLILSP